MSSLVKNLVKRRKITLDNYLSVDLAIIVYQFLTLENHFLGLGRVSKFYSLVAKNKLSLAPSLVIRNQIVAHGLFKIIGFGNTCVHVTRAEFSNHIYLDKKTCDVNVGLLKQFPNLAHVSVNQGSKPKHPKYLNESITDVRHWRPSNIFPFLLALPRSVCEFRLLHSPGVGMRTGDVSLNFKNELPSLRKLTICSFHDVPQISGPVTIDLIHYFQSTIIAPNVSTLVLGSTQTSDLAKMMNQFPKLRHLYVDMVIWVENHPLLKPAFFSRFETVTTTCQQMAKFVSKNSGADSKVFLVDKMFDI